MGDYGVVTGLQIQQVRYTTGAYAKMQDAKQTARRTEKSRGQRLRRTLSSTFSSSSCCSPPPSCPCHLPAKHMLAISPFVDTKDWAAYLTFRTLAFALLHRLVALLGRRLRLGSEEPVQATLLFRVQELRQLLGALAYALLTASPPRQYDVSAQEERNGRRT